MPQNKYPFFDKPLTATKLGARTWRVDCAFRFYLSESDFVEVPAGFVTDLASVPRPFWNIFPPDGDYTQAAVTHDFLYNQKGKVPPTRSRSRSECDGIFLSGMKTLGASWDERYPIWLAVRSFGWLFWK